MRASAASPFRQPRGVATTLTRLGPLSSPCRAGNVKILRGAWSVELFRILEGFPDLAHDDEVDASSGSLEILNLQMRNWGPKKPIAYRQQAEHLRVKKGRLMRRQPKAQTLAPLAGNRGFESTSLQQRVRLSQEPIFVGQEPRLSARVCPAAFPVRSTESRGARPHRTNPQQYLCRAIFQYRISGDAVATSYRVKVARPVPNQVGLPPGSEMPVDLASWDRAQAKPSAVR